LGWHLIFYNIKKIMGLSVSGKMQTFLFFEIVVCVFPDNAFLSIVL